MTALLKNFSSNPKNDILSGLTVALALVPEAVAFAFVAGLDPLVGLYGAFIMGIITSVFGGRPGMISGATGAMAVVMVHLIQEGNAVGLALDEAIPNLGLQWLLATLIIVGLIQILGGVARLGKFVRLIPHPVMMGFVNGLAIVIFLSQLGMFKETINGVSTWLTGSVSTVGSFIKDGGGTGLNGGLPVFQSQLFQMTDTIGGHWGLVISTAFLLAAVGLIESLMTLNLVDEITETRGSGNRECVAQGFGNILCGLFGGMGGCAMIGQSIINVESGGRGRLSGIVAAMTLLSFVLFGSSLIEQIPIAALVGVMFMVVIGTFAWSSFRILNKIPLSDAIVLIAVSVITVWHDLAIAVIAGVIMSALVFAWENATMIRARKRIKEDGTKVYEIWGPLFFGSVQNFNSKFDVKNDPDMVELDFIESKVSDHSGLEALRNLANKYLDSGRTIPLSHLSPECKKLLIRANPKWNEYIQSAIDDPRYYVVTDKMDKDV